MKTYKRSTKIYSLIYSIKILGLLLPMTGLIRCKCGALPNPNPHSSQTPPAPDKPKGFDIPDHTDASATTSHHQEGNRTAITKEMLDRVKNSSLNNLDKKDLQNALKSFQPSQSSEKSKKLSAISYEWALDYAIDIEDGEIIQALLERKDQVEGNIAWNDIMAKTFWKNKEVGLKALLKSGVEANQSVLKTAIQYHTTPNIIKILLDPQQNPQTPTLIVKELLEEAFDQVAKQQDSEGKIKAMFFAFLDPKINPQFNELKINKEMLTDVAIHYPQPDVLEKLFETFTITLTDEEIRDLISTFAFYKDSEKNLKVILQGLIKQKSLVAIQKILTKEFNTIGTVTSQRPEYKDIFTQLKLL